jgi:HrpA-like RNA helicase/O-acetyl-ADP-ribose deacetylase (regulator of RNase III)/endonuclease/exonuclease/phosphatase family metal-dependent hydrolase
VKQQTLNRIGIGDAASSSSIGRTLFFVSSGDTARVTGTSLDGTAWTLDSGRVAKKAAEGHAWNWSAAPSPSPQTSLSGTSLSAAPTATAPMEVWQFDAPGGWKPYDAADQQTLAAAHATGQNTLTLVRGEWSYSVDFVAMTQTNAQTGTARCIRQISESPEITISGIARRPQLSMAGASTPPRATRTDLQQSALTSSNIGRTLFFVSSGDTACVTGTSLDDKAWTLDSGRVAKKAAEGHAWNWSAAPSPSPQTSLSGSSPSAPKVFAPRPQSAPAAPPHTPSKGLQQSALTSPSIGRTLFFVTTGDTACVTGTSLDGTAWTLDSGRVAKKAAEGHAWNWSAALSVSASAQSAMPAPMAEQQKPLSAPPPTPAGFKSVFETQSSDSDEQADTVEISAVTEAKAAKAARLINLVVDPQSHPQSGASEERITELENDAPLSRTSSQPTLVREWIEAPSTLPLTPVASTKKVVCRFGWDCTRHGCYFHHPDGTKAAGDSMHARFTAVSYNIQAAGTRDYFDPTDHSAVDDSLSHVFAIAAPKPPDVISLQELQRCTTSVTQGYCQYCDSGRCKHNHADYVMNTLDKMGYSGHIHEAGDMVNTVGLFWRKDAFKLQSLTCDTHATAAIPTKKGALYAQLLHLQSRESVAFVALHPSVPMDSDQKPDTSKSMSEVRQILAKATHLFEPEVPRILAGDFNSVPTVTPGCANPDVYNYVVQQGYSSAYKIAQGQEPEFTSIRPNFRHCIDFIFLKSSANMTVTKVLGIRQSKAGRLTEPSDHVPIMAEFMMKVDVKKPAQNRAPKQAWTKPSAPGNAVDPNGQVATTTRPKTGGLLRTSSGTRQLSGTKDKVEIDVGGKRLILCIGDLTDFTGDAIVNAANEKMLGGGGVDGAIHAAAGPALLSACLNVPQDEPDVRCPTGEARITMAPTPEGFGRLQTDCVIHTVGPRGTAANRDAKLAAAYTSSIRLAAEAGLRSVAFPSISTGIYGFPLDAAASIAMRVCEDELATASSLHTIAFFFSNKVTFDAYCAATGGVLESFLQTVVAEKNKAEKEKTNPKRAHERARLQTPTEKPVAADLPVDIKHLKPSDPEYTAALPRLADLPVSNGVKVVNVDTRDQNYTGFTNALKQDGAPTQEFQVFHGTQSPAAAKAIARCGPNLDQTANGRAYGNGFYTTTSVNTAKGYAGDGSICVCTIVPGRLNEGGDSSTTLATLQSQTPPKHSVHTTHGSDDWYILMHPDSVRVDYIVDLGHASEDDDNQDLMEKAMKKWEGQEQIRQLKLDKHDARVTMCDQFQRFCDNTVARLSGGSAGPSELKQLPVCEPEPEMETGHTPQQFERCKHMFERELEQFHHGLPMYSRKEEFLDLLENNQAIVLKGGTGIGKTVTVPQWVFDNGFYDKGKPNARVAVLVPRKAIAEGLAKYISKVRQCELGTNVGLGTGDGSLFTDATNLCFMTYGYFLAISASDKDFSRWSAVILDEAHERNPDADKLLTQMSKACKVRPDFKAIVMSATIDVNVFAHKMVELGTGTCPVIDVPGVTYPVEVHFCDTWDSQADGAEHALAKEVVTIFNHEDGNVLCFLPTIGMVEAAADATSKMVKHDPNVLVKEMYAALPSTLRDNVLDFGKSPQDKGKRMICFSTNVAEAGVTIPGISAVVETGKEMSVVYNQLTHTSSGKEEWISKASHMQRRGRAGRTAEGRCFCLFSAEEFAAMAEYSTPSIEKTDLVPFYLKMIASGHKPSQFELLDMPAQERTDAALATLRDLDAIDEQVDITDMGEMMSRLPVDPMMARCIVAATDLGVCAEMSIIAALVSGRKSVFVRGDAGDEAKKHFRIPSGDHESLLNVYEQWFDHAYKGERWREDWCTREGVDSEILHTADKLLTKMHRSMQNSGLVITTNQSTDRSELIGKALCAGMSANLAVAKDTSSLKAGFTLVEDFDTAPTDVLLHPGSVIPHTEEGVDAVVFQAKQTSKKGKLLVNCLTKVDRSWIDEMSGNVKIMKMLRSMERVNFEVPLPDMPSKIICTAVQANIKNVQHEYPKAIIKVHVQRPAKPKPKHPPAKGATKVQTAITGKLTVSCLTAERAGIERRIRQCVSAAQPVTSTINIEASVCKWLLENKGANIQALSKKLKGKYNMFVQLSVTDTDGFDSAGVLEVRTMQAISSLVTADATAAVMAESSLIPNATFQLPTGGSDGSVPITPAGKSDKGEAMRIKLLSDPGSVEAIKRAYSSNVTEGAMMLMTHYITHQTSMYVYGGYVRDFVISGSLAMDRFGKVESDIDIGIGNETPESGLEMLARFGKQHQIDLESRQNKGSRVLEAIFKPAGGNAFPIELVDSAHFAKQDGKIDFDVNNLLLQPPAAGKELIAHKFVGQGGAVNMIIHNARCKQLVVLKRPEEISDRIQKMKGRGWRFMSWGNAGG